MEPFPVGGRCGFREESGRLPLRRFLGLQPSALLADVADTPQKPAWEIESKPIERTQEFPVTMTQAPFRPEMTMEEILSVAPAARRALFQRYHIGGCSSCAFQPTDKLTQVCKDHNILDVGEVIRTIEIAQEMDAKLQVDPPQVKAWIDAGEDFSFIDVRSPDEIERMRIPKAEPLDFDAPDKYMSLPHDRKIVFHCQSGERSLDVAAYFKGHGFERVYSLRGGIEAWSAQVDRSVQPA
jgi:rhodanese-related sulfurtransferase